MSSVANICTGPVGEDKGLFSTYCVQHYVLSVCVISMHIEFAKEDYWGQCHSVGVGFKL